MSAWPYDADQHDPLTAHRIAVTSSHPGWYYLVCFDRESEARPTEHETQLLVSFLDQYKAHWYTPGSAFSQKMAERPFDIDGGANGAIFHKFGEDDWGYRRQSFTLGWLFAVVPPACRAQYADECTAEPYSLLALMDRIHSFGDDPNPWWVQWKDEHPEVFGGAS